MIPAFSTNQVLVVYANDHAAQLGSLSGQLLDLQHELHVVEISMLVGWSFVILLMASIFLHLRGTSSSAPVSNPRRLTQNELESTFGKTINEPK